MNLAASLAGLVAVSSAAVPMAAPAQTIRDEPRFASGSSARSIPFEFDRSLIFLRVAVEGSRPRVFIMDTGANRSIVSVSIARALDVRLQPVGKVQGGIGSDPPDAFLVGSRLAFGMPGVTFWIDSTVAATLDATEACVGRHIDGILGAEFFASFVVSIDYRARRIDLEERHTFDYAGPGHVVPLEIDERYAFVKARITSTTHATGDARLVLDTGAGDLTLTRDFGRAHAMLPAERAAAPARECGIGGMSNGQTAVVTAETLQFGDVRESAPRVVFYDKTLQRDYDGLLGNTALRRYRVILDYSRSRMILESPRP